MQGSMNSCVPERETVPVHGSKDDTPLFDPSVKPRQIKSAVTNSINGRPVSSTRQPHVAVPHSSPPTPASSSSSSSFHGNVPEATRSLPASTHNRGGESGDESRKTHLQEDVCTIKGNNKSVLVSGSTSSTSSEVETESPKIVLPPSPPSPRNNITFIHEPQPLGPTRLSKLRQSHLAIKRKDQVKGRSMKLPELSENSELDITETPTSLAQTKDPHSPSITHYITSLSRDQDMPQISVTSVDYLEPPTPADDPVTPSLPSSFLKRLGLADKVKSSEQEENNDNGVSVDQLPQKEIESKFISLSLAFKTDKFTLEQRVSVQERARDLAEQNVDAEIKGLRELLESLNEMVSDPQARAMVQKLRQHIEVLEQAAARVSSRAEVYGAVQQEKRMSKAMEVMVLYTENIRRLREKEESELLEARKVLSERSINGFSMDADPSPGRRSMSVSGVSPGGRPMRRRSEIALPRVLGGSGSPSMIQTSSMETVSPFMERSYPNYNFLSVSADMAVGEDAKSRFQSAVASTSMQHAVTNTMRKVSIEKQRSMSFTPSTSTSSHSSLSLTPPSSFRRDDHQSMSGLADSGRKISQEEDAFRKGYEEGLKAKLSRELNELKEQQNCINQNLEHMMDKVDQTEQEDEEFLSRPTRLDTLLNYTSRFTQQIIHHDWSSNKKAIRNMAGLVLVFLAIFVIFLSPPVSTVDVKQMTQPPT
ncbi:hypothetical protein Btru_005586 [Bulinus truncatus]|nr:hypothetical protein Btru_005586 [Bulinus truncatus]